MNYEQVKLPNSYNPMNGKSFNEMLRSTFKSDDTEEWLDVHFTRPIGLVFALFWIRLGVHPNAVTILSIFLGLAAAWNFYFTDLTHNLIGVALLMLANFCDSTDGQMARLTGKKTVVGRVLDGFSGDVWFFSIYLAICLRMMPQPMPFCDRPWGIWIWVLAAFTGLVLHLPQSSTSDYYRQIHLFFLKGREGSELDSYASQRAIYDALPRKGAFWERLFYYNYANYCRGQEKRTPQFQRFFNEYVQGISLAPCPSSLASSLDSVRESFLEGSRPLMKYTNLLTFNLRAIVIYATCLIGCPWVYFVFEMTVLHGMYLYMHTKHERLSQRLYGVLKDLNI